MRLQYTLLGDGPSDRALVPILDWTLRRHLPAVALVRNVADLSRMPRPPDRADLAARITAAVDLFPCDVLFVHRDAEQSDQFEERRREIDQATRDAELDVAVVPVIPVRMTEAWLLFDEQAIRDAAGNPRSRVGLDLPSRQRVEHIHAKDRLRELLRQASELRGRRAQRFREATAIQRLADLIRDFSPLLELASFRVLEADVREYARTHAPGLGTRTGQ